MTTSRSHDSNGSVMIVILLIVPLAFAIAGVVLDPALLMADKGEAFALANAAARAGADEVSPEARRQNKLLLDPQAADDAARRYLAAAGGDWTATVEATPERIVVKVEAFRDARLLRLVGFSGKTVRAIGAAVPVQGGAGSP